MKSTDKHKRLAQAICVIADFSSFSKKFSSPFVTSNELDKPPGSCRLRDPIYPLHFVKHEKTDKGGIHAKQLQAGWKEDYLLKVLSAGN